MAQTATQWLRKEISKLGTRSRFYHDVMGLIDEAEKKEKEQIIDAHHHGFTEGVCFGATTVYKYMTAEQYYNETYQTQVQ